MAARKTSWASHTVVVMVNKWLLVHLKFLGGNISHSFKGYDDRTQSYQGTTNLFKARFKNILPISRTTVSTTF